MSSEQSNWVYAGIFVLLVSVSLAIVLYNLLQPEEGDECNPKDYDKDVVVEKKGNYEIKEIEDKKQCVLKSCITGWSVVGSECVMDDVTDDDTADDDTADDDTTASSNVAPSASATVPSTYTNYVDIVEKSGVFGLNTDHIEHQPGLIPGSANDLNDCISKCDLNTSCASMGYNSSNKDCFLFKGHFDSTSSITGHADMYSRNVGQQWRSGGGGVWSANKKKYTNYVDIVEKSGVFGLNTDHIEHQPGLIPGSANDLNDCISKCDLNTSCASMGYNSSNKDCFLFKGHFDSTSSITGHADMYSRNVGQQWRSGGGGVWSANKKK